jgi:hypothetical protein
MFLRSQEKQNQNQNMSLGNYSVPVLDSCAITGRTVVAAAKSRRGTHSVSSGQSCAGPIHFEEISSRLPLQDTAPATGRAGRGGRRPTDRVQDQASTKPRLTGLGALLAAWRNGKGPLFEDGYPIVRSGRWLVPLTRQTANALQPIDCFWRASG